MSGLKNKYDSFRYNNKNTELFQYIFSFGFGLMFGAISLGFFWLMVFIAIYEVFYAFITEGKSPYWVAYVRINVELLCVIGWMLGRWLMLRLDPVKEIFKKDPNDFTVDKFLD